MTAISENFTLDEVTHSQTAARLGIDNDLPAELLANVKGAALGMEMVRKELGKPIRVSSWYRGPKLNAAIPGSSKTSAHMTGMAIDFTCPGYGSPEQIVKALIKSNIPFDQVIHEFGSWVHISFRGERRQALVIDKHGTRTFA